MAIRVGMVSLGCPKNQMDAELMLAKLETAGLEIVADAALAEVVIINTCGFIESAKQEAIETILEFAQLKKEGQIKKLIVTGCLAQRYKQELADELPECDAVLGLGANGDIADIVSAVMDDNAVYRFPSRQCWSLDGARVLTTPSFFAYMRVGDGCDNCCTYCAIPHIRGRLRSREIDTLVGEATALAQSGVKELILVAQDTTLYGKDLYGESRLPELLERLCEIEGLEWIRLLYCYPEHISEDLLRVIASQPKIVKYMDIPLQHASGKVLEAMRRTGDRERLTALIAHIREAVPGIVLRTTVMTGFPGETDEDFEELCEFLQDARFERLGCFAYSAEEGTIAASMPDQVEEAVKEKRRDIVMQQQDRISQEWLEAQIGKTVTVLVESFDKYAECWFGRTAADAPDIDGKVFFTADVPVKAGDLVQVEITDYMDWDLIGECV
ncbi:MAG: 30S ribosomal protein S12 methylthiotransferase RimO [Ruminococcaceae bacterium]|nr:30S ribosomal protein S12 methylthiotransferase RimO [Oscillospiraceae bacterium]